MSFEVRKIEGPLGTLVLFGHNRTGKRVSTMVDTSGPFLQSQHLSLICFTFPFYLYYNDCSYVGNTKSSVAMILDQISYFDCFVFLVFLAPQLLLHVNVFELLICIVQALPFFREC